MVARRLWAPDRRDMIWINCNPQAGREMRDIHPLLVLSPKAFNERTGIVIGLPMTTSSFNETNPFAVKFVGPRRRVRQAKPHPWGQIPEDMFALACETLNQIITIG